MLTLLSNVAPHPVGATYRASIPSGEMALHGAGYPLTFRFRVPLVGALRGQWRVPGGAWTNLPAAPATGRWDGVEVVRREGAVAYLSKAFEDGVPSLELRIIDSSERPAGVFEEVCTTYDDRTPVVFTYDDTPWSVAELQDSTARHQGLRLWMTPGWNWSSLQGKLSAATAAHAGGYIEISNHTVDHSNAGGFANQEQADASYVGNVDALLANIGADPFSRGRILSAIYPFGAHNWYAYEACRRSGHLTARLITSSETSVADCVYSAAPVDQNYGLVTRQEPTINPKPGSAGPFPTVGTEASELASKVLAAVNHARENRFPQCHVYSYTRHWEWGADKPWPLMLAEIAAMDDIWSVGYGHLALYQRMRQSTAVELI